MNNIEQDVLLTSCRNEKIRKIISEIKKYEFFDTSLEETQDSYLEDELIVIVGDSKYPSKSKGVSVNNLTPFGIYKKYKFSEIAFLCNQKTIELFSIVGLLFDSMDDAAELINILLCQNLMDAFAKYLFYEKRLILVNASGQIVLIDNLLAVYKKHKILFCCGKKKGYGVKSFKHINGSKTNRKSDVYMRLKHPSSRSYQSGFINACSCYLDRTFIDKGSNLRIQTFKLF